MAKLYLPSPLTQSQLANPPQSPRPFPAGPRQGKLTPGDLDRAARYAGRPIHLTSVAQVGANSGAGSNNQALHNPVGGPVEIFQIKFAFNIAINETGNNYGDAMNLDGISVLCSIGLNGTTPITSGMVPIWNLGNSSNIVNEQLTGVPIPAVAGVTPVIYPNYGEFVWNLPRPMLLLPSDQLTIGFQNAGQSQEPINARFSIVGRVLPQGSKLPTKRYLPYAAAYVSKVFQTAIGAADTDQSTETDLANTTDAVIYVQRLSGRMDAFLSSNALHVEGADISGPFFTAPASFPPGDSVDIGLDLMTLKVYTGRGDPLAPYPTTFRGMFAGPTRSWEMDGHELLPGDYYIAALSKAAVTLTAIANIYSQASIGLVGWREVAI